MANRHIGDPNYSTNPFLNMVNLMEFVEPEPQQAERVPAAEAGQPGRVKLPEFWPHAPGIWFARADLRFEIFNVVSERQKFALTIDSLPYESLCLVADLVENPPANTPYTILKDRLLMSHQLTPVQRAAKLMDQPDLGSRRPSQMLADLLQDCPPGEQGTAFFRAAFLKRLPADIQVHLAQVDSMDLKELAQRADQLFLTHRRPLAAVQPAAAVDEESAVSDSVLAAVAGKQAAGQQKRKPKKLVTYCWVHHRFGKTARRCDNPAECQWEN
jgi:hypothetical protein